VGRWRGVYCSALFLFVSSFKNIIRQHKTRLSYLQTLIIVTPSHPPSLPPSLPPPLYRKSPRNATSGSTATIASSAGNPNFWRCSSGRPATPIILITLSICRQPCHLLLLLLGEEEEGGEGWREEGY